ncbi:Rieske (2Fe-2S) protein [Umezawaea sp. Da 62-37]|uniref:Rieske (2Fe-2S) protein n=1 Tax=Umezawaea sp. Da 62-37 TaxID=3075927 RepID=UPI0028F6D68F|nr:Rieske (2Fe-2S) protein [Umezawaea sp. Da 62-37]WNV84231.1 Rieske (2Fe-2S) protein [Umezawaea sp. Da 62-37]
MTSLTENTALTSRRSMLCGLAVAMVVPGGLAACSTTTSSPSTGTGGTTGGGSTPTDGTGTGTTGGAAAGLAALADVPDGGGLIVESGGKPLVLTRTGETVKAFGAACPHQGTTVGAPAGGVITCPNHGSQFSATDGSLKKGPATKGLTEVPVKVADGQVVMA